MEIKVGNFWRVGGGRKGVGKGEEGKKKKRGEGGKKEQREERGNERGEGAFEYTGPALNAYF